MSDKITDIIQAAVHEAEGTTPEPVEADDTTEETIEETPEVEQIEDAPEVVADDLGEEKPAKEAKPVDKVAKPEDLMAKKLEELGIKPTKPGERENRLPHSRVVKIAENAVVKATTPLKAQVVELESKITAAEAKTKNMDAVDALISSDPDRYIQMLATLHPQKYGKYVGKAAEVPAAKPAVVDVGPRPAPDQKFEDGSLGYSADQHEKLLDWVASKAKAEAVAETKGMLDKEFKPVREREAQAALFAQNKPKVDAQIARASKRWGKAFDTDYALSKNPETQNQSKILKIMRDNPDLSFEESVSEALLPLVQQARDSQRADIIKEINGRRAAAKPNTTQASKAVADPNEVRDTESIIREAIAGLKR